MVGSVVVRMLEGSKVTSNDVNSTDLTRTVELNFIPTVEFTMAAIVKMFVIGSVDVDPLVIEFLSAIAVEDNTLVGLGFPVETL